MGEYIVFRLVAMRPILLYAYPCSTSVQKLAYWYWFLWQKSFGILLVVLSIYHICCVCAIHLMLSAHSYCDHHQCDTASLPRLLHSVHISGNL